MASFSAPRVIRVFLFALLAFSVYALLHAAVVSYLDDVFGIEFGWLFWVLGIASVSSFVISQGRHSTFTKLYYRASMTWMGLIVITSLVLLPVWLASLVRVRIPWWIALPTAGVFAVGGVIAAMSPVRKDLVVRTGKLAKPVTIVQISDVHLGEIYTPHYLRRLVALANKAEPDVVVITGDLFDGGGVIYDGMIDPLRELKAPALFITGNHEVYEGVRKTTTLVRQHGVRVLDDDAATVAGVQFVGISYPVDLDDDKRDVLRRLAKRLDRRKPVVVLRHEPRGLEDAAAIGADLLLSGHTHNGQIWPFNLFVKLVYEYAVGSHVKGGMAVYISPGAGTWGPPYRIGSRAEITVVKFMPDRKHT